MLKRLILAGLIMWWFDSVIIFINCFSFTLTDEIFIPPLKIFEVTEFYLNWDSLSKAINLEQFLKQILMYKVILGKSGNDISQNSIDSGYLVQGVEQEIRRLPF